MEAIEAEASPDAPSAPPAEGPTLPRVPGPHDRARKIVAIAFIATVLLGAAAVTLTRSPYFAAHTIEVRGTSHVTRSRGPADRRDRARDERVHARRRIRRGAAGAGSLDRAGNGHEGPALDVGHRGRRARRGRGRGERGSPPPGRGRRRAARGGAASHGGRAPHHHVDRARRPAGAGRLSRERHGRSPRWLRACGGRIHGVSILSDGQLRVDLSSGAEVAYGEAVELSEKAMALRALLDYAVQKGASVISADVRVPSAPTAVLSGGVVVAP